MTTQVEFFALSERRLRIELSYLDRTDLVSIESNQRREVLNAIESFADHVVTTILSNKFEVSDEFKALLDLIFERIHDARKVT